MWSNCKTSSTCNQGTSDEVWSWCTSSKDKWCRKLPDESSLIARALDGKKRTEVCPPRHNSPDMTIVYVLTEFDHQTQRYQHLEQYRYALKDSGGKRTCSGNF